MAIIQIDDGIKVPLSKKPLFLLVACFGPSSIGVMDVYRAHHVSSHPMLLEIIGWFTILFFGLLPIFLILTIFFHKASGLYINSKGVNMVTPFVKKFLSWDEISGFNEKGKIIIVRIKDLDDYLSKKSSFVRRWSKINMVQGSPYSINTIAYQCSPDELLEILKTNFEKYKS